MSHPSTPPPADRSGRHRPGPTPSPGWWPFPRRRRHHRRGCRAYLFGPSVAAALCVLAIVLALLPAVTR